MICNLTCFKYFVVDFMFISCAINVHKDWSIFHAKFAIVRKTKYCWNKTFLAMFIVKPIQKTAAEVGSTVCFGTLIIASIDPRVGPFSVSSVLWAAITRIDVKSIEALRGSVTVIIFIHGGYRRTYVFTRLSAITVAGNGCGVSSSWW